MTEKLSYSPSSPTRMKRFHVNVRIKGIPASVAFYSALFNTPPTVRKDDYAK